MTEEALKSGKPVKALDFVNCVKEKLNVDDKIMQAIYGVVVIKPKVSEKRDSNEPLAKGYQNFLTQDKTNNDFDANSVSQISAD